jgi:exopolyphosphatase/guanosine-5'-triphosphate,3'-diphosphate pyrophosphatase
MIAPVERAAVIDMGSNSFRLVVFGYEPDRWWSLTDEIREPVRISAGMGDSGLLQPEPVDRALHTAAVFASFCRAAGVDRVDAVATSAIRDASNGGELLEAIERRTGLRVRVIDGDEEARYGHLAIVNSTTLSDGFGIEMGGGSIQLLRVRGRLLTDSVSAPLGSVRVSELFLPGEKAGAKAIKALRRHVRETIGELDWWAAGDTPRLVGIGGTVRNLAAAAIKRGDYPDIDVQGFPLGRAQLEDLIEALAERPASKRGGLRGIKPDRGDVILGGALVLAEAIDQGGFDAVEVSEAGLREGVFFERLLERRERPLFDDVRRSSVVNLANRFDTDAVHVRHVGKLSAELYDGLAGAGLIEADPEARELLLAACMLHDIGMVVGYDDHHHHSHYLILNAGLPGLTPRELVLVGLIARYHRKGDPDPSELGDLARPGDSKLLRLLSAIIRLAEQLERSRDQSVEAISVSAGDGRVTLIPSVGGNDDPSVAIWSARRNADLLADAIGEDVDVAAPDAFSAAPGST